MLQVQLSRWCNCNCVVYLKCVLCWGIYNYTILHISLLYQWAWWLFQFKNRFRNRSWSSLLQSCCVITRQASTRENTATPRLPNGPVRKPKQTWRTKDCSISEKGRNFRNKQNRPVFVNIINKNQFSSAQLIKQWCLRKKESCNQCVNCMENFGTSTCPIQIAHSTWHSLNTQRGAAFEYYLTFAAKYRFRFAPIYKICISLCR